MKTNKKKGKFAEGEGVGLGLCLGVTLGIIFDELTLGISMGLILGILADEFAAGKKNKGSKERENNDREQ